MLGTTTHRLAAATSAVEAMSILQDGSRKASRDSRHPPKALL